MKLKGKIVQIIKEEESSKMMGTYKIPNTDWLNIISKELHDYQTSKKCKNYRILFLSSLVGAILFFVLDYFFKYTILFIIGSILLILCFYSSTKDIPQKREVWPLSQLIPIQKPHNYKVNDEIDITLELNKFGDSDEVSTM